MDGPGTPPFPSLFDLLRTQALVFDELRRLQGAVVEGLLHGYRPHAGPPPGPADPAGLMERLRGLLVQHPVAAQAAFSALVSEGRLFAATPEGAAWRAALASSELVRHGRQLWDALALNLLEENSSTLLPSSYLEAFFQAASSPDLERLLRRLREGAMGGSHGAP